jgi:hypothetical protein
MNNKLENNTMRIAKIRDFDVKMGTASNT